MVPKLVLAGVALEEPIKLDISATES